MKNRIRELRKSLNLSQEELAKQRYRAILAGSSCNTWYASNA